jgi:UDP-N-acetylmuramoyl-tripeptide--D-alanyl-D-alanine ligase
MAIENLYEIFQKCTDVCTDTRKIKSGDLFFALQGQSFDGNAFATDALAQGALYAVVDDARVVRDERYILVEDSLASLQALAAFHRTSLNIPVIGLTGSNGKTTTKELIAAVLSTQYKVAFTQGNLNNHIGVPLSILRIGTQTEIAVIEMGANHVGEIALLSSIAQPTHGLITNIGTAHIGEFGGFDNIIRGKSELYDYLRKTNGKVFINTNDAVLANMTKRFTAPLTYPNTGDWYHADLLRGHERLRLKDQEGIEIQTQLAGDFNFNNAAAALAVGKYFEVEAVKARAALASYTPSNMRSQIMHYKGVQIMLDAYNANPSSLNAALDYVKQHPAAHKGLVLGAMYELGDESISAHKGVGEKLAELNPTVVYLVGEDMRHAQEAYPAAKWFANTDELAKVLDWSAYTDHFFLIKGSRSMKLEELVNK